VKNHSCVICRWEDGLDPLNGGKIAETENFFVFHNQTHPAPVLGWLIIAPKAHILQQTAFSPDVLLELMELQQKMTAILEKTTRTGRVYWAVFGEEVKHLHFHLIPRPENLPAEALGWRIFGYKPEDGAGKREVEGFCDFIREQF